MKLLWILAPVGAVVLLSPLVTKPMIMEQFNSAVLQADKNANEIDLLLERQTEDSGFLSTSIVTRIQSVEGIASNSQAICLDVKTDISHSFSDILQGNIASTTTTILPLSEQDENCNIRQIFETDESLSNFYASNYGDNSPIIIRSEYSITGTPAGSFEILPFKVQIPKNEKGEGPVTIDSSSLIGNITASSSLDSYTFDMAWDGMSALIDSDSGPFKARIKSMTTEGNQYLAYDNIWLGDINQTFTELSISQMSDMEIKKYYLPSIEINSSAFEDSNGIQSRGAIALNGINGDLGNFELDFSLSNLDPEALSSITKIIDDLVSANEFQKVSMEGYEEVLVGHAKILIEKASFSINAIKYGVDNQEVKLDGILKAQNIANASFEQIQNNPMVLLQMFFLELNGKVDKGFSEAVSGPIAKAMSKNPNMSDNEFDVAKNGLKMMIDGQLESIMAMGFLIDQGATYNSALKFENGMPTINGQPLQLPTFPKP